MEKEVNRKLFKENLNKYMKERDVTQSELARYCGIERQSVQGWCSGKAFPRIDYIERISQCLNVEKSVLLGWQTEEEQKISMRIDNMGRMLLNYSKMSKLSETNFKIVCNLIDSLYEAENHNEEP